MLRRLAFAVCAAALLAAATAAAQPAPRNEASRAPAVREAMAARAVLSAYANMAEAMYQDSLARAEALRREIARFLVAPSEANLNIARFAWVVAREPYAQTEVFRFGNPAVDAWEGRVNAWPLDEGLIDYVDEIYAFADENPLATANVIAAREVMLAGRAIDTRAITKDLLAGVLQEAGGVETNVATGYHAIEFLLWGQDLNGTRPGAGARPWTDYSLATCTHDNCDRRIAYLRTATDLLIDDLAAMVQAWGPRGEARRFLLDGDLKAGLNAILTGIGSLGYGELAGERMKLGLLLHDPEEEQDCFSDNTHNSHYFNVVGMIAVWRGEYNRTDGSVLRGPGIGSLVHARHPALAAEMAARLADSESAMLAIRTRAATGMAYDQMLAPGNVEGAALIQAGIDALAAQTRVLERVVDALDVGRVRIQGSDSLDNPGAVAR